MKYAIATHSFLMTVEFNNEWEMQDVTILDTGHHYGIAVLDSSCFVAVKRVENKKEFPLLSMYDLDAEENPIKTIPIQEKTGDLHQIAYANDGIYIANTMYNNILFQSLDGNTCHRCPLGNISRDWNHPNSVYPCGDRIFVFLHNKGLKDNEVAILKHDLAKGFEIEDIKSLWFRKGHNLYISDKFLYYNASDMKRFVAVDLEKEQIADTLAFPGHVKGMSCTSNSIVVGFSDHVRRKTRFESQGSLAVIDKRILTVCSVIDMNFPSLPGPIGNINEIRCLSEKELAQSSPDLPDMDWMSMKLAKKDHFYRLKSKVAGPAWTARRVADWVARTRRHRRI